MQGNRWFIMLIIGLILAACNAQDAPPLPTLARLPSATATALDTVAAMRRTEPATFTPTSTGTVTASFTPSVTVSGVPTLTVTPSATITDTPSPTATDLPTIAPEERPMLGLLEAALRHTPLPTGFFVPTVVQGQSLVNPTNAGTGNFTGAPSPIPPLVNGAFPNPNPVVVSCTTIAAGGFGTVYAQPNVAPLMGCPLSNEAQANIPAAWQNFQEGIMIWVNGEMLVLYRSGSTYQRFPDTFVAGVDPETSSETPPSGLHTPIRGFLKVWSTNPSVRSSLGWATIPEQGASAVIQTFANGRMIYLPGRADVLLLVGTSSGNWQSAVGRY